MKKWCAFLTTLVMVPALLMMWGCEWEKSDDFNTSGGAGVNVNFSGTYQIAGVPGVTTLVLTQTGNALRGSDNLGNSYSGSIGSPGIVANPDADGVYPAGATMLQTQVNLSDGGTTTIVGNIRAVSVTDIQGATSSTTVGAGSDISVDISGGNLTGTITTNVNTTITTTTTYSVDASNTHYILSGTWSTGTGSFGMTGDASAAGGGGITL